MQKQLAFIGCGLLIVMSLVACFNSEPETSQSQIIRSSSTSSTEITSITLTPQENIVPTKGLEMLATGPLLLIQSGATTYQILDVLNQIAYPFNPPGPDQYYNLSASLSPSGHQMIFPVREGEVQVVDLRTGQVHTTYLTSSDSSHFNVNQTTQEAQQTLSGLHYTKEDLLSAIQNAYLLSRNIIRWYQSDRYRLSVVDGGETSTQLILDDDETDQHYPLENMPALVENFWIGPGGDHILLKKSFVYEPGIWQDDDYYLIDVKERSAQPIPLPVDCDHPALSWLDRDHLGIIHKTQLTGGIGFSVYSIESKEITQLLEGSFTRFTPYLGNLFVMRTENYVGTTTIERFTFSGELLHTNRIEHECFFNQVIGNKVLLNCERESYLVHENLQIELYGEPIFILSLSPDTEKAIFVTRTEETYLLDATLQTRQQLALEGPPLEIRWLPDSSGFIYRMRAKLYYYDLVERASQLLLTSVIFDDYTNINAVWINLN